MGTTKAPFRLDIKLAKQRTCQPLVHKNRKNLKLK